MGVRALALSISLGDSAVGAIKTQHRVTERDRFSGLATERGKPGGLRVAPTAESPRLMRSPKNL